MVGQHAREIAGRPLSKYTELAKTNRLRAMLQSVEPGRMLP